MKRWSNPKRLLDVLFQHIGLKQQEPFLGYCFGPFVTQKWPKFTSAVVFQRRIYKASVFIRMVDIKIMVNISRKKKLTVPFAILLRLETTVSQWNGSLLLLRLFYVMLLVQNIHIMAHLIRFLSLQRFWNEIRLSEPDFSPAAIEPQPSEMCLLLPE